MSPSLSFAYAASGAFLSIYGATTLMRALGARRWQVVTGEIIESRLKGWYTGTTFRWDAVVRYRYRIRGKEYEADRVSFGNLAILGWQRIAERVHEKYPLGTRVSVRVCPTNPSRAVLEVGPNVSLYSYLGVGVVLVAIGLRGMFLSR